MACRVTGIPTRVRSVPGLRAQPGGMHHPSHLFREVQTPRWQKWDLIRSWPPRQGYSLTSPAPPRARKSVSARPVALQSSLGWRVCDCIRLTRGRKVPSGRSRSAKGMLREPAGACTIVRDLSAFTKALDSIKTRDVSSSHARARLGLRAVESASWPRVQQRHICCAKTDTIDDIRDKKNWIARTNKIIENLGPNATYRTCRLPSNCTRSAVPTASTCAWTPTRLRAVPNPRPWLALRKCNAKRNFVVRINKREASYAL